MKNKIFFNDSHGHKISAYLSTPSDEIVPIIILFHGLNSGQDSNANRSLEKIFLEHNFATFDVDFFSCGESEGNIEERNIEEFVDNVLSAIKFLKEKKYTTLGLYGCSFGGVASVIAASKNSDVKVMALKAAGIGKKSRTLSNYKKDFDEQTWITAGTKVKIPTLIVHGSKDEDVELQFSKDLAKSIKNSKLEIIEDADHRFTKKEDFDKCITLLSEFIIHNLTKE
ncbi:MAG: alpha/beta hydrolase family protein [Candidatus Nanoarchaeia archaeon]